MPHPSYSCSCTLYYLFLHPPPCLITHSSLTSSPSQIDLLKSITLPAGPSSGRTTAAPSGVDVEDGFKLGLMRIAVHAAARAAELSSDYPDAYDISTRGLRSALSELGTRLNLPLELESLRRDALDKMEQTAAAALSARSPLVRKKAAGGSAGGQARREFNPRFEDGFTKGRDYDPDRERAEQRKLKRQVGKEKRGERVWDLGGWEV